jgi:hypothetical protein
MYKINSFNRDYIIERYVDDIVGGLHFIDIKSRLKQCLMQEKHYISSEELEYEIMRQDPMLMSDIHIEELIEEATSA